jgi:two-component system, sensor histidine kinase and response regulator
LQKTGKYRAGHLKNRFVYEVGDCYKQIRCNACKKQGCCNHYGSSYHISIISAICLRYFALFLQSRCKKMTLNKTILASTTALLCLAFSCTQQLRAQTVAIDSLQKVFALQKTDTGKILVQAAIAKAYWYIRPDTAIKIGERLAAEAHSLNFFKGEALCYNNIAVAYDVSGNYPKALDYHFKALRIRDEIKDIAGRADSENNIGEIYKIKGDYDKALTYYLQSVASTKEAADPRGPGITYVALSELYLLKKEYTTSLYYSKLAEAAIMASSNPDMFWVMQVWNNTGTAQLALKNYAQALGYHQKALEAAIGSKEKYIQANALNGIARVYIETGSPAKAIDTINRALALFVEVNAKLEIRDTYLLLSAAYEKMGNYNRALALYKLGAAAQDSLFNDEKAKLMNVIAYSYEIDKKQQQIELLAKDNELNRAKSKQQFIGLLFLAGMVLCAAAIAFLLYRNGRIKERNNKELLAQKEQISAQAAELEAVNKTKDKLFAIIGHDLRGPVGSLGLMLNLIGQDEMSQDEFKKVANEIKDEVDTVYITLENLLIWSRSQMKGIQTVKKTLDMAHAADRPMQLLQQAADAKNITLVNEIPRGSYALADNDQVDFIIRNLVANAIKFTPHGGLISVAAAKANGWLTISVKDNGSGIEEAVQQQLFSIDYVSGDSYSGSKAGTGLGLIMCREFVENNGGRIWVESKVGEGSVFYFTLTAG